ncbi:MAG TPA: energy-coupling factor transporter transmembrane component T, partial [Syntrophales bacterium]|nr:energy-coupling factor transporter transmembrane component T [Syntrophales bacterium]
TGGPAVRIRAARALAVPLLLSAFRRADELAEAMEAGGYRRGPRTTLYVPRLARPDYTAFALLAAFTLINFSLRWIA